MRKIAIVVTILSTAVLAGCATNRDTGAVVGGVAGGILGNQVGGGTGKVVATGVGAAVGAAVGSAVGSDMDQRKTTAPVENRRVVREEVMIIQNSSHCDNFPTVGERLACERGVRQRILEEQRRREQEAYRQGYGR